MGNRYNPFTGNMTASKVLESAQPSGEKIAMVRPDGTPVYVTKDEYQDAKFANYVDDTPEMEKERELKEKYSGGLRKAEAFAAGAGRGVSFGLSDLALSKIGGEGARDELEQLKKYQPVASLAGQITGVTAGLIGTGGLGAAAEGAEATTVLSGAAKARQMIPGGPGAYLTKIAESAASNITGKGLGSAIARGAVSGAVEGAGYGLGEGVSEASLQKGDLSPTEVAETLLVNTGIGAVTGGGIGAGTGALGHGLKKALTKFMGEATTVGAPTGDLVKGTGVGAKEAQEGLQLVKGNRDEIVSAARSLDIPPENIPDMVISGDEQTQKLWGSLAAKPGEVGERVRAPIKAYNEGIQNASESIFMDATNKTENELGQTIRESVLGKASQLKNELSTARYEPINHQFETIPVGEELKSGSAKILNEAAKKSNANGTFSTTLRNYAEDLQNIEHAGQLKELGTDVGTELRQANSSLTADPRKARALSIIQDEIKKLQASAISEAEKSGIVDKTFSDALKHANEGHRQYKEAVTELANQFKLGKVNRLESLEQKFEGLSNEALAKKFFPTNDIEAQNYLKKQFPELHEQLRKAYLGELRNGLNVKGPTGGDVIGVSKLLNKVEKLSPETQHSIFSTSELERLKSIKILHSEIPPKFGPSGTPEGIAYLMHGADTVLDSVANGYAKAGIPGVAIELGKKLARSTVGQMRDEALYAMLKSGSSPIGKAVHSTEKTIYGKLAEFATSTSKHLKKNGIKVGGVAAIGSSAVTHFENHQDHLDELARLSTDPNYLVKNLTDSTKAIAEAHPEVTSAIHDTVVRAVNFLQDHAPKNPGMTNAFGKVSYRPSDAELAKYDRYLKVINNPLSVLDDLNNRVLTAESVEALSNVYPDTYNKITKTATELLTNKEHKISYQDKNQLAILLGSPVTSSQNQSFIQSMQKSFGNDITQDPQQSEGSKPSPSNFKTNASGRSQTDLQSTLSRRNA